MGTADDQIRVSTTVKRALDRRKRGDESYNDVLERMLGERSGDFAAGFGMLSDERADTIREEREHAKEDRKQRLRRVADEG